MFIVVDGIDGSGKSTLARELKTELEVTHSVFLTGEPTSYSIWGQRLRRSAVEGRLPIAQELEYFRIDRAWHLDHHIKPALSAGDVVISDRYVDSTLAFQAKDADDAEALYRSMINEILIPDITFIINCSVDVAIQRIKKRDRGKFSQYENRDTLVKAALIYSARQGPHYVHLDGSRSSKEVMTQASKRLAAQMQYY